MTVILLAIIWIILVGGIGIALWGIAAYNGFITLSNKIEEAFSTMDVYLKKRYDLIPNLVETVKGYASHEKTTFENVTNARNFSMRYFEIEEGGFAPVPGDRGPEVTFTLRAPFSARATWIFSVSAGFEEETGALVLLKLEARSEHKIYKRVSELLAERGIMLLAVPKGRKEGEA